jgi:hypothetical protein
MTSSCEHVRTIEGTQLMSKSRSANATMGVNSILRSLTGVWEQGDKLLYISTTM